MLITIDRIEGNRVVLEFSDMTTVVVPRGLFPDAKEGDIYKISKEQDQKDKTPFKKPVVTTMSESEITELVKKADEQRQKEREESGRVVCFGGYA